jgi:hypothetical protein
VAHIYAGILGPLAFLTSLARGAIRGGGEEGVLWTAWAALLAFAAVGYVVGWVAERIVEDSVRGSILARLAADAEPSTGRPAASEATSE